MKRRLGYLGLWLVGTVLAVAMAWLGLRSVLVAATPGRLDLLDQLGPDVVAGGSRAGAQRDGIALGPVTSSSPAEATTSTPSGRTPTGIPMQQPRGPRSGGPVGPGGPSVTTPPSPRPTEKGGGQPTTILSAAGTTTPPPTGATLLGQSEAQTRTVRTRGGDSTLRFTENDVSVLTARPVSGYEVKVEQISATAVVVIFSSPTGQSRVQASWNDGPTWHVTEYH